MRSKIAILFCVCFVLMMTGTGCLVQKISDNSDVERLQGTWRLVYQQINGIKLPDERTSEMCHGRMVFSGDKIRYIVELPGFDLEFAYKLDQEQQPRAIDLQITNTPDKKDIRQRTFGIYLLENETLKICHSKSIRPTEFDARQGSHNSLIVLKRTN